MGILIENLTKSFKEHTLFSNFSCEFPERGLVKVGGVSGAGKTTLLRMISGLDTDYSGNISGVGTVSYLFQEYRLFPWLSALDNVVVADFEKHDLDGRDSSIVLLRRLGFSDESMLLKPSKLSGGMKQRVSLARALLRDSDVLLLDEPTKELDPALVRTVGELIAEAAKSRLVLLVSHDNSLNTLDFKFEITVSQE